MPRIRTIKPTHWSDKELAGLSLQAHLLWIATWNFSDDDGVFEGDPILIKSQVFPRRQDIRLEQIKSWLDQLVKARFLIPFQYNGEGYYVSRTFKAHQRIDKPQVGNVPENYLEKVFQEYSENISRTLLPVEYSSVEECKGEDILVGFEIFWDLYDKKVGDKEKVKKKWDALSKSVHEQILNHVTLYKTAQPNKKYRKDPATYLNQKAWNDELIYENGYAGKQQAKMKSYLEENPDANKW